MAAARWALHGGGVCAGTSHAHATHPRLCVHACACVCTPVPVCARLCPCVHACACVRTHVFPPPSLLQVPMATSGSTGKNSVTNSSSSFRLIISTSSLSCSCTHLDRPTPPKGAMRTRPWPAQATCERTASTRGCSTTFVGMRVSMRVSTPRGQHAHHVIMPARTLDRLSVVGTGSRNTPG